MTDIFKFGSQVSICAPKGFESTLIHELWNGFTFTASKAVFTEGVDGIITIGKASAEKASDSCILTVERDGIVISAGKSYSLLDGFCKLLSLIRPIELEKGKEELCIPCGSYEIKNTLKNKMLHLCVFPETTLFTLKRLIRLAGFLRYTHIILEFWGTYRYKCMPALAWKDKSYIYDELKPLINEANELGMEVIPDFNHLGHASMSRIIYGKHTALDQDPRAAVYFSDDGWAWNLDYPKLRPMLKELRRELCELCGESKYFHIGCDECYTYAEDEKQMERVADYLADLCKEVESEGRRPILWGDMFLHRETLGAGEGEHYACNCMNLEVAEKMLAKLPKCAVIADWQYDVYKEDWRSADFFAKHGFDTLLCPWTNIDSALSTVKKHNAFGLMETTWHHLHAMTYKILYINKKEEFPEKSFTDDIMRAQTATLLRKLCPATEYEEAGWCENQMEPYSR